MACFLHPIGNVAAQGHVQWCPGVYDTQWCWWVLDPASPGSLVLRWRGFMGKLPEQGVQDWGYRTMNTGTPGCSNLGHDSDRLSETDSAWQLKVEVQGLFTLFIAHSSSGYCQLSRLPEDRSGRSGNLGPGFSPLLAVLLKGIVVVRELMVGINKCWIILGFTCSLCFHFLHDSLLVQVNSFP